MARSFPFLREFSKNQNRSPLPFLQPTRAGVVPRDIKPRNVMISEDGMVEVLDFGLAKPLDQVESSLA